MKRARRLLSKRNGGGGGTGEFVLLDPRWLASVTLYTVPMRRRQIWVDLFIEYSTAVLSSALTPRTSRNRCFSRAPWASKVCWELENNANWQGLLLVLCIPTFLTVVFFRQYYFIFYTWIIYSLCTVLM